ncbi:hypothetical protein [Plantibacter sp. MMLR14_011]|uniref:hypothetical protein n=1 Tax=Plantibacter sp. MMLR14_011 TaxID=1898746 RepID=UPI001587722C|nr:hypothetical protein [Plantibacter sp. MMLR14_011]
MKQGVAVQLTGGPVFGLEGASPPLDIAELPDLDPDFDYDDALVAEAASVALTAFEQ